MSSTSSHRYRLIIIFFFFFMGIDIFICMGCFSSLVHICTREPQYINIICISRMVARFSNTYQHWYTYRYLYENTSVATLWCTIFLVFTVLLDMNVWRRARRYLFLVKHQWTNAELAERSRFYKIFIHFLNWPLIFYRYWKHCFQIAYFTIPRPKIIKMRH